MITKPAYKELQQHFENTYSRNISELFTLEHNRAKDFSLNLDGLLFDFSKNNISEKTLNLLIKLANQSDLANKITSLFSGDKVNNTEKRAALHIALRAKNCHIRLDNHDICSDIKQVFARMAAFTDRVRNKEHLGYTGKAITDVVNIGIGGSDLGPALACEALADYAIKGIKIHFISSVDGYQINHLLTELNPATTLFIIASKTFTTSETMANAVTAREWFLAQAQQVEYIQYHFVAASTNKQKVAEFGIDINNMFEFWDFIGGRYSMFSAIGLSIMLYIGSENFYQLLAGARAMDEHFVNTKELRYNIPVIMALIGVWHINFYNYASLVISPYNTRLAKLSAYIQQLEMESNGKSVNRLGEPLNYKTCPIIWGGNGINGQHAYYQLLHQGTSINPMDIIVAFSHQFSSTIHQDILVANALAQAEAFMNGKSYEDALAELISSGVSVNEAQFLAKHKVFNGNRPTNMLVLKEISPYYLGMLIAFYEHKTFTQGVIWNINSFDQMGVELGKQLAKVIENDIATNHVSKHDSSTSSLIDKYIKCRFDSK